MLEEPRKEAPTGSLLMSASPQPDQPATYETLAVRSERPGFCVAHGGPLIVPIWTRTATAEQVDLVADVQRHVLREFPKFVVLTIIRAELSMSVPDDVRERSRANIDEFEDRSVRNVMIVEEGGLRASFFRGVVTGVYFLSRKTKSQKVATSIDEGLDWLFEPLLAGQDGLSLDPHAAARLRADVKRFADDVCERYPPIADPS